MIKISTSFIPVDSVIYGTKNNIDYRSVCVFAALGFFLENDTYWAEQKTLPAASECVIDSNELVSAKKHFEWHYSPREISLAQATTEFADLFESIVREQTKGKRVILPLSGGLDSRTQAAALKNVNAEVCSFSYAFEGGHDETEYSKNIAEGQNFPFRSWKIKAGYLWEKIDRLAQINSCYSEFTHPRQMAFLEKYQELGDVFSLGHWGDVLFDDMGVADDLPPEKQVDVLLKKIVKKGGVDMAESLWQAFGLPGKFKDYLVQRVSEMLFAINIPNSANARIRAFKSLYWATRWTSINLSVFAAARPITLPYYDNRMCEFICTVPETHLSGRRIQIEYLKRKAPQLAKIMWQDHRPFNLTNYHWDKTPWNLPYRAFQKAKRVVSHKKFIQRNWELQFTGEENDRKLCERLFEEPKFSEWIPKELVRDFYLKFKNEDAVYYSHSVSTLLTLSLFSKHFKDCKKASAPSSAKGEAQTESALAG